VSPDKWFCDICEPKKEFETMEARNDHIADEHGADREALA